MPEPLRVALVDIDGTLLDSNYHHTLAWSRGFAAVGRPVPLWRIHRHMGMGGDRLVAAVAGDEVEEEHGDAIRERWEKEFDSLLESTRLLPGAGELLDALAASGLDVVLASSGKPHHTEHALDLLDADRRAAACTTSEDAEETKPDAELLQRALDKVGAGPEVAVVLGDSVWDVEAAQRLGVPTIGLLTGGFGRAELLEAGAVTVYDDPPDLVVQLERALDLATRKREQLAS
ncbi:MAG TPA: HAD family hydrolase [Marmoricola sp.]|nr:HAD family hydrolase [Marmoricola sp.]